MGRRAKPAALKAALGNPGKRRLPKEPKIRSGAGAPPAHLSAAAKAEWRRLAPQLDQLGLLKQIDRAAFEAYCCAYATWIAAKRVVDRKGLTYEANGLVKVRPEVRVMQDHSRLLRSYLTEFGLSPSSRAKVASQMSEQPFLPGLAPRPSEAAAPPKGPAETTDDEYFGGNLH